MSLIFKLLGIFIDLMLIIADKLLCAYEKLNKYFPGEPIRHKTIRYIINSPYKEGEKIHISAYQFQQLKELIIVQNEGVDPNNVMILNQKEDSKKC